MIPAVQIVMNTASSFGFTAFLNIIIDGSDNVVTPIIKESTTPSLPLLQAKLQQSGLFQKYQRTSECLL